MVIGIDFDNTLVRYDEVFHRLALEKGYIPADVPAVKDSVRDYLRAEGKPDVWTELQGHVYGPGMKQVRLFPGAREFLARCRKLEISVHVISHRTRYPFLGPKHDLREAASQWLEEQGFYDPKRIGLGRDHVHFESTQQDKLERIRDLGCAYFIDDLPEFLGEADFPSGVRRILFDPSGGHAISLGMARARSWDEVGEMIIPDPAKPIEGERLTAAAADLIHAAGLEGDFSLRSLPGSANNRPFRVERGAGAPLFLKLYFRHEDDPRDRLGAEFSFSTFAWGNGVRALPRPLAADHINQLGLYEFVEGRHLRPEEVSRGIVDQALDFFHSVNRLRNLPGAQGLSKAAEACYSLSDHLQCVERRLEALKALRPLSECDGAAADFVRNDLSRAWPRVFEQVCGRARALGLPLADQVDGEDRCLSPSDFGFHNALLESGGSLRFVDFEYAGWDDPAKMVCDFFCQPAVPLPPKHYQEFARGAVAGLKEPHACLRRISLLLPVYRFKWCCILLNDFVPIGMVRRRFARMELDGESQKKRQLEKARQFLEDSLKEQVFKLP